MHGKQEVRLSEIDTRSTYGTAYYWVTLTTTFKRFRTGHLDMPFYKQWTDQLVDEIRGKFDEERIWHKVKDDVLFHDVTRRAH